MTMEKVGPPTRPVCGAAAAHNGKLSHLLSMFLKEVNRPDNAGCELLKTYSLR